MELYKSKEAALAALAVKPPLHGKQWYVERVESGHWAVFWRWTTVSTIFNQDRKRGFGA